MGRQGSFFAAVTDRVRAFVADTSGGLSVEYAMWVPFMASGMVLTTDITILMQEQSYLFVAARDTSRIVATGQMSDAKAMEVMDARLGTDKAYVVKVESDGTFVTSKIAVPYSDVLVFGGMFTGTNSLTGQVTMLIEGADLGA